MNSKENGNRSIDVKLNKIDYAVLLVDCNIYYYTYIARGSPV